MQTQIPSQREVVDRNTSATPVPRSADLGRDLKRLERAEREKDDRQRQAELAALRRVQDLD